MKGISKPLCVQSGPIILIGNDITGGPRWASKATEQSSPAHWHAHTTATPPLPLFLPLTEMKCISLRACTNKGQKTIIVGLAQTQLDGYGEKKKTNEQNSPERSLLLITKGWCGWLESPELWKAEGSKKKWRMTNNLRAESAGIQVVRDTTRVRERGKHTLTTHSGRINRHIEGLCIQKCSFMNPKYIYDIKV